MTTSAISKHKCNYYGLIRDNRERRNLLTTILAIVNLPDLALQGCGCLGAGDGMFQPPVGAGQPGGQEPPGQLGQAAPVLHRARGSAGREENPTFRWRKEP